MNNAECADTNVFLCTGDDTKSGNFVSVRTIIRYLAL